jgi:GNAT superfamily N-acetyltransferase
MVLAVPDSSDEPGYVPDLEAAGYVLRIREPDWFDHRVFKGPATDVNLHVFSESCSEIARMIHFRDWIRTHPDDRDLYAATKRSLAVREWERVQDYADTKSEVVYEILTRSGWKDAVTVRPEALDGPRSRELIALLNSELSARYPEQGANHFRLDPDEVAPGRGIFLIAYVRCEPVACGALRRLDAKTGEIKRMYVREGFRGRGLSKTILEALEAQAGTLAIERLVLETGERQVEALSLYEKAGYRPIPRFGEYEGSPLSACLAKSLGKRAAL